MIEIEKKENCCSCTACYSACPVKAITMIEDNEGFKYPKVDKDKCINCGLCKRVCPILNINKKSNNNAKPDIYAAWSKDDFVRLDSTSGGIFSELANKIYEQNGSVCGAIYDENNKVIHYVSNNKDDIDKIRSSKYVQSDINGVFDTIKNNLKSGNLVLFCGSPCQVAGLYNFLGKEYENLYTVDFICRGMNSPKIFSKYLESLEKKYNSKVVNIKFKNKFFGWHNFSTRIDFENGKKYIGWRYFDSYMVGYLRYNAFMRPSCYNCHFKDLPRSADITLADFWGIENINKNLDADKGTSMILINSNQGQKLFDMVKNNLKYEKVVSKQIFDSNICMRKSVEETEARKSVFENIDEMSYDELCKKYFPTPGFLKRQYYKFKYHRKIVNKNQGR